MNKKDTLLNRMNSEASSRTIIKMNLTQEQLNKVNKLIADKSNADDAIQELKKSRRGV